MLTEVDFPHGCARRNLGRARHRGDAVLRSDAGQDHRQGPRPRRRAGEDAAGAGANARRRHRDQPRLSAPDRARCRFRARGGRPRAAANGSTISPHTIEVLEPGVQTTVQDWPGRLGYWDVGVPPSGPDGRAGVPSGQPAGGQCRRRGGPGDHAGRADAALQQRQRDRAAPARRWAPTLDGKPVAHWRKRMR